MSRPSQRPLRRRRLGLRSRVTVAFAGGAAALSGILAGATYGFAHHYLLNQRQSAAVDQAYVDASQVKQGLTAPAANVASVLASLSPGQGDRSLVFRAGRWYSTSVSVGRSVLPEQLVSVVQSGAPARQRITISSGAAVVIGVPLPAVDANYFEVHSLSELARTLDLLAVVLAAAAAATTLGGAAIGRWASGRLVRPLAGVADVAAAISTGSLDQRLSETEDPDLDRLVISFNQMVDALAARIEHDARFASDVSHELRSPLTTVQTSVELLEKFEASLPADGKRAVQLLAGEIGRFSAMVQDLLEISRVDAGAASLDLENLPLDEFVTRTVDAHSGHTVQVHVDASADGVTVRVDARRMQRVIVNLLDNARLHAGGAVLVGVETDNGLARVIVDDAGPGVAVDEQPRVFERFYRGRSAGKRGEGSGTGLGLALVAEHVRAHGGQVFVTDRPGGGARFTVEIPVSGP
ncbi:MAG TPA: HAMP domain-containing sensor histidine kinase [Acidimicrobiales bacterium]|nr:HAMP domain-containing sensor histidine kinase [Acidimicrobiales bacterium]